MKTRIEVSRLLLIALFSLLLLVTACDRMFYYPSSIVYKREIGREHSDIYIKSESGNLIHGWYFPSKESRGLVLYFHGNSRNVTAMYKGFVWLVDNGFDYIVWDYSGYGKSEGFPDREDIYLDGLAMLRYGAKRKKSMLKNKEYYPYITLGQSLGGAVLLGSLGGYEGIDNVDLLIVDCTFASYKTVTRLHSENIALLSNFGSIFVTDKYAGIHTISNLDNTAKLVSHCRQDETVPFKAGKEIYSNMKGDKTWWEFDCKHTKAYWREEVQTSLVEFIEEKLYTDIEVNEEDTVATEETGEDSK